MTKRFPSNDEGPRLPVRKSMKDPTQEKIRHACKVSTMTTRDNAHAHASLRRVTTHVHICDSIEKYFKLKDPKTLSSFFVVSLKTIFQFFSISFFFFPILIFS